MKGDLRKCMKEKRAALSEEEALQKNQAIHSKLLASSVLEEAEKILVYLSFDHEIDTRPLIDRWLEEKRQVYVPVMEAETRSIFPVRIFEGYRNLPKNNYGIQEPSLDEASVLDVGQLDLVIVPGLAFDKLGNRLGYGGGYYDRFIPKLSETAKTVALCYGFQLVEEVPVDPFDQKIQLILTELQEETL